MPQRTPAQAYQHVLDSIDKGTVNPSIMSGACMYRGDFYGKTLNCGVGCLFNTAQLDDIDKNGMNSHEVEELAIWLGEGNLLEVTGLSMGELINLQDIHDKSNDVEIFRRYVQRKLAELA